MRSNYGHIDALAAELGRLSPLKPEYKQRLDKKFRLDFSFNSNHIEGNTLTYSETELLLVFHKTTGNHDMREYEEMKAHDVAFEMIKEWAQDAERPLTEAAIKNLHELLLVRPFWKEAITPDGQPTRRLIEVGQYKKHPNSVRLQNGEMFHYSSPEGTPVEMGELIDWYRDGDSVHPVERAAMLHYKFVRIHPFDDGNGRLSRLLMNYVLLKNGLPPVIIKSEDKKSYLFALNQADAGDYAPFISYIAEQVVWSLEISIKAAKGESIDEPGDLDKKLHLLKKKLGHNGNAKVEITYSVEALERVIHETIFPLLDEWEMKLKDFDSLFFSRVAVAKMAGSVMMGDNVFDVFNLLQEGLIERRSPSFLEAPTASVSCNFTGLRTSQNQTSYNGGEINFYFHRNAFEVSFTGSSERVSKLYTEFLMTDERNEIIETMGNWFIDIIEKTIESEQ